MNLIHLYDRSIPPSYARIPSDLLPQVSRLRQVVRFNHPEYHGIVKCNTGDHTARLTFFMKRPEEIRMAVAHDLAEEVYLKNGAGCDSTMLEKSYNVALSKRSERLENAYARTHLSDELQELRRRYNRASAYLKGKTTSLWGLTNTAVCVKVGDISEGNHTFHYYVSEQTMHPNFLPEVMPTDRGLLVGLHGDLRMLALLETLPPRYQSSVDFGRELILTTFRDIRYWWFELERPYIPPVIQQFFSEHMALIK